MSSLVCMVVPPAPRTPDGKLATSGLVVNGTDVLGVVKQLQSRVAELEQQVQTINASYESGKHLPHIECAVPLL